MSLVLKNIISMESDYDDLVTPEEAEGAVEEVEATEIVDEVTSDTDMMDDYSRELDETVTDVEELQTTSNVLEDAIANENYEGLDALSAEVIGQRLRSISKRRGFDVGFLPEEVSAENFGSRISGRRRKTEIALEGIKDAIVRMWERIKAAIKAIWQAIKDFWKKHISTLGRLLKALEKTKRRVRDLNGNPTGESPKAPSGVQKAYWVGTNTTITVKNVKDYGDGLVAALDTSENILSKVTDAIKEVAKLSKPGDVPSVRPEKIADFDKVVSTLENNHALGTKEKPLVNGWFIDIDKEALDDENPKFEFTWDRREVKPSDNRTITVAGRSELESLCEDTIKLIKATQRFGDNFNKVNNEYDRAMNIMNQAFHNMKESQFTGMANNANQSNTQREIEQNIPDRTFFTNLKNIFTLGGVTREEKRKVEEIIKKNENNITAKDLFVINRTIVQFAIRKSSAIARVLPKINSKITGLNVTHGKQVISFCNTCASNYKELN